MKKLATLLFLGIFIFSAAFNAIAQEEEDVLLLGADFNSRYIWRGASFATSAPVIQPFMEVAIGSKLVIGALGTASIGTSPGLHEVDLFLRFTPIEMIELTVLDYFIYGEDGEGVDYFDWNDTTTLHILEAILKINAPSDIPMYLTFAMNLYGADVRNKDNDIVMSKYLELGYENKIGNYDFSAFVGMALDNPDEGTGAGFYGQKNLGIVNLGVKMSKAIKITDNFSLPVSGSVIVNPETKGAYFVFGISL